MAETPRVEVPALDRAAAIISLVAAVAWLIDILTRPPCPPGYVRLLDLELAFPPVSLMVGGVSLWLYLRAGDRKERGEEPRKGFIVAIVVLGAASALLVGSGAAIISHRTAFDSGCWTF